MTPAEVPMKSSLPGMIPINKNAPIPNACARPNAIARAKNQPALTNQIQFHFISLRNEIRQDGVVFGQFAFKPGNGSRYPALEFIPASGQPPMKIGGSATSLG